MATKSKKKILNIMTACDEGYARLILPQFVSIDEHLKNYEVNFFLLYNRITPKTIKLLKDFCDELGTIDFHPVLVNKNIDMYNLLASGGGVSNFAGQVFPYEVFFPLDCYKYLPKWVERVIYIHSADIIFMDDIAEYYFSDFKGKSLTVEVNSKRFIKSHNRGSILPYNPEDRGEYIQKFGASSFYFNSGSFMINIDKLRKDKRRLEDFIAIREQFIDNSPDAKNGKYYRGDQSFFSVAFLGDVNPLGELTSQQINRREYNYGPLVKKYRAIDGKESIDSPKIIHFDSGSIKPWQLEPFFFDSGVPSKVDEKNFINGLHDFRLISVQEYFLAYWDFLKKTPIYDDVLADAQLFSKWLKKYYLPELRIDMRHQQKIIKLENEHALINDRLKSVEAIVTNND